jgi:hypothetical protein
MVYNALNYWPCALGPSERFGNWVCFRLQVSGGRRLLCWKEVTSITNSMEMSPSREAESCAATQELHGI